MNSKTVLLVEDDFLNRRLSKKVLVENNYRVLEAKNAKEALSLLDKEAIDFIILDINLGEQERDGISLGQEIKDTYSIPFAYLTAYEHMAVMTKAVATAPCSYISKPFKHTDLIAAVELGMRQFAPPPKRKATLVVREGDFYTELVIEEICHIESDKNYLQFYTPDKVFKTRNTIKQIMQQLPPADFVQTHRAFIVNINRIERFSLKSLVVNGYEIPISRNYLEGIKNLYK